MHFDIFILIKDHLSKKHIKYYQMVLFCSCYLGLQAHSLVGHPDGPEQCHLVPALHKASPCFANHCGIAVDSQSPMTDGCCKTR